MPDLPSFEDVARSGQFWLTGGRVPGVLLENSSPGPDLVDAGEGLRATDILIDGGTIAALEAPSKRTGPSIDLRGGQVWPGFVDMHTHLDKGHIWPRRPNPDGTFMGALDNVELDRTAHWSAADVRARAEFALSCAYAHGTTAIRTHLDSIPPQDGISWPVFEDLRQEWAGRIALQGVSLFAIESAREAGFVDSIADRVAAANGVMGAVSYMVPDIKPLLLSVFAAAVSRNLDLDFHVDESLDPGAQSLEVIADIALETGFSGRIVCGHCCALSILPDAGAERVLAKIANAGIGIVSLPMCNLYLQDRTPGRTPRRRGITLIHEMRAMGIEVAIASDNTRDPFYAYGDLDGLEVFREAVRIGHLDHPIDDAPALITSVPAGLMGLDKLGSIKVGGPADLIAFDGRTYTELLARPEAHRVVVRNGRPFKPALPDYRDLDPIVGAA